MKIDFTEIFCHVDDFFKELDNKTNSITNKNNKPGCRSRLNRSEIITIIIGYWQASYDCFKNYYLKQIWVPHQRDFQIVSYCQFIKLIGPYLPTTTGIAARGKTTKGWFYGLKSHLIVNRS